MPVVSVQPFDLTGMRADQATPIEGLRRKLRDALARFDEIEVAAEIAPSEKARADYYLAATAEWQRKGAISLDFRLLDASDDTVAWTRSFANLPGSGDPAAIQDDVVRQVVATLAPPYGVIYARELTRHTGNNRDPRYLCMLDSFEYRRNYAFERRVRVRACLRKVLELDPTFAGGFAAVTTIALYDYFYLDGGQRALDEALNAAKRAVELAPESARAHQAMMNVLFARDQVPGALGEGAKAVQLNPLDMLVLATYGMRLVSAGEIDRGRAALNQAAALGSVRPAFLDFFLFVSAYLRGDDASAAFHASLLTSEAYPFALVARALVAAKAGNLDRARQIVDRLLALHPQWRSNAREAMLRYIHSTAIVDRLAGDLAPAGFPDRR
jgi:tetratricopeptide (TPR) repeat protein